MSIIQKSNGNIELYRIDDLLIDYGAVTTLSINVGSDETQKVNIEIDELLEYKNYLSIVADTRWIEIKKYFPIPIELVICWIILDNRYSTTIFTTTVDNESLRIKVNRSREVYRIRIFSEGGSRNFRLLGTTPSMLIQSTFLNIGNILYSMKGPGNHNISRNSKLWIKTIEQLFLTKYISPYKLHEISTYNYDLRLTEYPYIFDLKVITSIPISITNNYYFEHCEEFESSMTLDFCELGTAIRVSEIDKIIRIVPAEILEDSSIFDNNNKPRLSNITINGIHHIYRYVELIFKQGIATKEEQSNVAAEFGLVLSESTYIDIIKILNKI